MYDDNYAAAAAAVRAGQADEDEDDFILQQDPDKPGFVSWAEALSTRHFSQVDKCSVGYWDEAQNAVALTKCRGKKQLVMGYSIGGTRYLDPDEALYLVDDGQLMLLASHPETGADLRPGMSRVAALTAPAVESGGAESCRRPAAAATVSSGSAAGKMAVDDAADAVAAAVGAPTAAAAPPAGAPPKWKNNDDLMEHLERQMDEDADADADGCSDEGVGADDNVDKDAAVEQEEEEDSYDEEEEAEMRGAVVSQSTRDQSAPQAAGASASGDVVAGIAGPVASTIAAAAGKDGYLPLPSAYAFLLQHVRLPEYLVYLHLRSTGLVALRHRPHAQAAEQVLPTAAAAAAATGVAADMAAESALAITAATASDAADDAGAAAEPQAPLTPAPVLLHAAGQERWLAAPAAPAAATAAASGGSAAAPVSSSSSADACSSFARMPSSAGSSNDTGAAGGRSICAHCKTKSTCSSTSSGGSSSRGGGAAARAAGSVSRWVTSVEPDVQPVYDAYARDGITSFKPSAPGPPDFYVCVQTADQPPPTPAQVLRLSERLARHMAALRERQRVRGVACLPSFSEVGGGGGVSGAMLGKGTSHMSRVGTGAIAGSASADGGPEDAASAFAPNIKVAIVAHTAITFFTATPVELRLPQRFLPRVGGPPVALVSGAAAMAAPVSAEAAVCGAQAFGNPG